MLLDQNVELVESVEAAMPVLLRAGQFTAQDPPTIQEAHKIGYEILNELIKIVSGYPDKVGLFTELETAPPTPEPSISGMAALTIVDEYVLSIDCPEPSPSESMLFYLDGFAQLNDLHTRPSARGDREREDEAS